MFYYVMVARLAFVIVFEVRRILIVRFGVEIFHLFSIWSMQYFFSFDI